MFCQDLSLRRSSRSKRPALYAEALEARFCPSTAKMAPQLTYTVEKMCDPTATITGHVASETIGPSTVEFTGVFTQTVTTDINGDFTFSVSVARLGSIYARAFDSENTASDVVKSFVTSLPPGFNSFTVTRGLNNLWTFSGSVFNEELVGLTVSFQGLDGTLNTSTNVCSNGTFSTGVLIPNGTTGTIVATVADCFGLTGTASTII